MVNNRKRVIREKTGIVTSDKMNKSIVVEVSRIAKHPVFGKTISKFAKFKAHDEKNEARTGDTVRIMETRPISRDKRWKLVKVLIRKK